MQDMTTELKPCTGSILLQLCDILAEANDSHLANKCPLTLATHPKLPLFVDFLFPHKLNITAAAQNTVQSWAQETLHCCWLPFGSLTNDSNAATKTVKSL